MNFVGSFCLETARERDLSAFWLFATLVARLGLLDMYAPGMRRLQLCFFQLERLLLWHAPQLHGHLHALQIVPELYATSWFVTLFTDFSLLPKRAVDELWDQIVARDGAPQQQWGLVFAVLLWLLDALAPAVAGEPFDVTLATLCRFRRTSRTSLPAAAVRKILALAAARGRRPSRWASSSSFSPRSGSAAAPPTRARERAGRIAFDEEDRRARARRGADDAPGPAGAVSAQALGIAPGRVKRARGISRSELALRSRRAQNNQLAQLECYANCAQPASYSATSAAFIRSIIARRSGRSVRAVSVCRFVRVERSFLCVAHSTCCERGRREDWGLSCIPATRSVVAARLKRP